MKRKIVKPIEEDMSMCIFKYSCRICGTTFKHIVGKAKPNDLPNFCWCCGTQLKEVDTKLFELWGIEP